MLHLLRRSHLGFVQLEELLWARRMHASDIVECGGRDVVCLAFAHETVILKKVFLLRSVKIGLRFEDALRLAPVIW